MARLEPTEGRARLHDTIDGLEIVIPAKTHIFTAFFLFWLGGWGWGEVTVVRDLINGSRNAAFEVFWLGGWTLGGVFAAYVVLWNLFGRERITLSGDALIVRREVLGVGRVREYSLDHVRALRLSPPVLGSRGPGPFPLASNALIAFDYGASTVRFGLSIDEPEASGIIERMRRRHRFVD